MLVASSEKFNTPRGRETPRWAVCPPGEMSPGTAGASSDSRGLVRRCLPLGYREDQNGGNSLSFPPWGMGHFHPLAKRDPRGRTQSLGTPVDLGTPMRHSTPRSSLKGKPEAVEQQM